MRQRQSRDLKLVQEKHSASTLRSCSSYARRARAPRVRARARASALTTLRAAVEHGEQTCCRRARSWPRFLQATATMSRTRRDASTPRYLRVPAALAVSVLGVSSAVNAFTGCSIPQKAPGSSVDAHVVDDAARRDALAHRGDGSTTPDAPATAADSGIGIDAAIAVDAAIAIDAVVADARPDAPPDAAVQPDASVPVDAAPPDVPLG
jgi:hypothetical protein